MTSSTNNANSAEQTTEQDKPSIEPTAVLRKVLSIDPSVNSVGFATLQILNNGEQIWNWGTWELAGYNLLQRCADLAAYVQQSGNADITDLILEWPTFYDSEKGNVAAKQDYTINLAAVAMYLAGFLHLNVGQIELVTAPQWKGQATKAMTARRFFQHFGQNSLMVDHNQVDATMLLLARAQKRGWL